MSFHPNRRPAWAPAPIAARVRALIERARATCTRKQPSICYDVAQGKRDLFVTHVGYLWQMHVAGARVERLAAVLVALVAEVLSWGARTLGCLRTLTTREADADARADAAQLRAVLDPSPENIERAIAETTQHIAHSYELIAGYQEIERTRTQSSAA